MGHYHYQYQYQLSIIDKFHKNGKTYNSVVWLKLKISTSVIHTKEKKKD